MSDKSEKLALVTGATGVVGPCLVRALIDNGYKVRALCRNTVHILPNETEILIGDLENIDDLKKACANVDVVFHLAAKLHINSPKSSLNDEYYKTNVKGTEDLVAAALSCNVKKFVFFSTINVYGAGDRVKIFDETCEVNPQGIYAESKLQGEKIVLHSGIGVVVRLAAVYGSRMKGNWLSVAKMVKKGAFFIVGSGKNRRTLIHQEDAALAAIKVAENSSIGSIVNATDGKVYTFSEIVESISAAENNPNAIKHLPIKLIKPFALLSDKIAALFSRTSPIGMNAIEKMTEDIAVSGEKLKVEFKFQPKYDLTSGWRETLNKH